MKIGIDLIGKSAAKITSAVTEFGGGSLSNGIIELTKEAHKQGIAKGVNQQAAKTAATLKKTCIYAGCTLAACALVYGGYKVHEHYTNT